MNRIGRLFAILAVTGVTTIGAMEGAMAAAGRVVFAIGDIKAVNSAGVERALVRGQSIEEGEIIRSGANGQAQLRMVDGAFIAVRPDTEMKFDQYKFAGKEDGSENAFISLLRGGFRSITGLIGNLNKSKYVVSTPVATIGIRGSDIEPRFVLPPSPGQQPVAPPGAYVQTNAQAGSSSGSTMTKNGVTVFGGPNTVLFGSTTPGELPRVLPPDQIPPIFKAPPVGGVAAKPVAEEEKTAAADGKPAADKPASDQPAADKPAADTAQAGAKPAADQAGTEAAAGTPPAGQAAATGEPQAVRTTAVVDNTAKPGGALGMTTTPSPTAGGTPSPAPTAQQSTTTTTRPTVMTTEGVTGTATLSADTTTVTSGQFVYDIAAKTTTDTQTGNTFVQDTVSSGGQLVIGDFGILATQQATDAQNSFSAANTALGTVNTAIGDAATFNNATQAVTPASNTAANNAIATAATAIGNASGGATQTVNLVSALALTTQQADAASKASSADATRTTATGQSTSATSVYNANGAFRDPIYAIAAKNAMDAAKTALDSAEASVQAQKASIDTQVTTLGTSKTAASNALAAANTAQAAAIVDRDAGNAENAKIALAQTTAASAKLTADAQLAIAQGAAGSGTTTLDPNPLMANSTVASGCATAKACADLANQYAAEATAQMVAKNFTAAQNAYDNALKASQNAAVFQATAANAATTAQQAAETVSTQQENAEAAATAAATAFANTVTKAGAGAGGALNQANTAQAQASAAQAAFDAVTTPGTGLLATLTADEATVNAQAATVAQQAVIAQYNNPANATPDRFASAVLSTENVAANSNKLVEATTDSATKANTNYVLDGAKNLVEIRDTPFEVEAFNAAANPNLTNANVKFVGGTAMDGSGTAHVDTTRGSVYFGRWAGGSIDVDSGTYTVALGARSAHWIIGYTPVPFFVQSLGGTTTYTRVGNTSPTDIAGNTGTLTSATLSANFDNQTVTSTIAVSIASKSLSMTGTNMPIIGNGFESAVLAASCSGAGCASAWGGELEGQFLRSDASAVGLGYIFAEQVTPGSNYTSMVQGVALLTTGTAPVQAPTVSIAQNAANQAQADYNAALAAQSAVGAAVLNASAQNTAAQGVSTVDTTPATNAINAATTAIGNAGAGATQAVNNAAALTIATEQADAAIKATNAAALKSTAASQASAAASAYTANGAFQDPTYATAAKNAMDAAKAAVDSAEADIQTRKGVIDTQVGVLSGANAAAQAALSAATTQLSAANADLSTANTENAKIGPAQTAASSAASTAASQQAIVDAATGSGTTTPDPAPRTAGSSVASSCGTAKACSDLAAQYASETLAAQTGGDLPGAINAKDNALTAASRATTFRTTATNAQTTASQSSNDASTQNTIAQNAVTAAGSAVSAASTKAGAGAGGAQAEASTAQTQAAAAQTAVTTAVNEAAALTTSHTNATTQAVTVAQQAVIAQYNNPANATPDRFGAAVLSSENVGANANKIAEGPITGGKANTNYVLDGTKNLVEIRSTPFVVGAADPAAPSPGYADANVKFVGGTAADGSGASFVDPTNGSAYLGRWAGGSIEVDDTSNGVGVDHMIALGARSAHWLIGYQSTPFFVQGLGGTTSYTVAGNTSPTDMAGNVGTLGTTTLSANFDAQMVTASVNVNIASKALGMTSGAMPINGIGFESGTLSASCSGAGCATTWIGGMEGQFLRTDASAVGLGYTFAELVAPGANFMDLVQGVVLLTTGTPPTAAPPAPLNVATAYLANINSTATQAFEAGAADYTLDGNGHLVSVADLEGDHSHALSGGTVNTLAQIVLSDGRKISFGRRDGGTVTVVDDGSTTTPAIFGSYQWIAGPRPSSVILPDALTTSATYTYAGGVAPIDQTGTSGTLNSATLSVDFNRQAVNAAVSATVGPNNWIGTANNMRLDGGQFAAFSGSPDPGRTMTVTNNAGAAFGSLSGALMGASLNGAGLTYAFSDSTNTVTGSAGFTGAAQTVPSHVTGVLAYGATASNLAVYEPEHAFGVQLGVTATSRLVKDTTNAIVGFDGKLPVEYGTGCPGGCFATEKPVAFLAADALFGAPPAPGSSGVTAVATLTDKGTDATTGISWGRYTGYIKFTDRITSAVSTAGTHINAACGAPPCPNQWHGMFSGTQTAAPILPTTGTLNYTLAGGTRPTDNFGNVAAAVPNATLSADFTNMKVNVAIPTFTVNSNTFSASTVAGGVPIQQNTFFEAGTGNSTLNVTSSIAGTPAGQLQGIFTGNHVAASGGGVMMGYSLNVGGAGGTTVSGSTAFRK